MVDLLFGSTLFIQSQPNFGFVFLSLSNFEAFLIVIDYSICQCFSFKLYPVVIYISLPNPSIPNGWSGVLSIFNFGINVIGKAMSMINLFGSVLINAVIVKNSGPLIFVECVEFIVCFPECMGSCGIFGNSFVLYVFPLPQTRIVSRLLKW